MAKNILIVAIIDMPTENDEEKAIGQGVILACPECKQILPYNDHQLTWPQGLISSGEIGCRICERWFQVPRSLKKAAIQYQQSTQA